MDAVLRTVPLDPGLWAGEAALRPAQHLGRECAVVESGAANPLLVLDGVELRDGVIEVELAVRGARLPRRLLAGA